MEIKHKNILIGALLAVVFVMAVGYAAFAQTLTINGSATIDSTWDVHMVDDAEGGHEATAVGSSNMGTTPANPTVEVGEGGLTATLTAELVSPGDSVVYTIPITNAGTLNAKYDGITMSGADFGLDSATSQTSATSTSGNIKYEVTKVPGTTLNAGAWDTIQVTVTYLDYVGQESAFGETAEIVINVNYSQAA